MDYKRLHKWTLINELKNPECAELMRDLRVTFYENKTLADWISAAQDPKYNSYNPDNAGFNPDNAGLNQALDQRAWALGGLFR